MAGGTVGFVGLDLQLEASTIRDDKRHYRRYATCCHVGLLQALFFFHTKVRMARQRVGNSKFGDVTLIFNYEVSKSRDAASRPCH